MTEVATEEVIKVVAVAMEEARAVEVAIEEAKAMAVMKFDDICIYVCVFVYE